jgi:uncharacterized delta-60 repeat protein
VKRSLLFSIVVVGLALPLVARAAAGDLDPSFGSGGKVFTDFGSTRDSAGRAVAIQPNGKIVVTGFSSIRGSDEDDFALARYNRDGSLDQSFGSGGRVLTDFGVGSSNQAHALAIEPDGRIVAAGWSLSLAPGTFYFALARYNRDGSLDQSFGAGGKVLTDIGPFGGMAQAVAIQPNGKIVAAGDNFSGFALVRYNPDGSLDSSFGSGGKVFTDLGFGSRAWSVAIEPRGKIVAAGQGITEGECFPDTACVEFGLARYNRDGSLDQSFGSGGKVFTDFAQSFDEALDMTIEPGGKIVAAGVSDAAGSNDFALARYNRHGSLDQSFGSGGKVLTDFASGSYDQAWGVARMPNGKLIAVGIGGLPIETGDHDAALARYDRDGSLDQTFGSGGKVLTDVGFGADDVFDGAIDPAGRIVAVGGKGGDFVALRFLGR